MSQGAPSFFGSTVGSVDIVRCDEQSNVMHPNQHSHYTFG